MAMATLPNCGTPATMTTFRTFSKGGGTALFGTLASCTPQRRAWATWRTRLHLELSSVFPVSFVCTWAAPTHPFIRVDAEFCAL